MAHLATRHLALGLLLFPTLLAMGCASAAGTDQGIADAQGAEVSASSVSVDASVGEVAGDEPDTLRGDEADAPSDAGPNDSASTDAQPEGEEVFVQDLCAEVDCDDGLDCTLDSCDAATGSCAWELLTGRCLIGGACHEAGATHPVDGCRLCNPVVSSTSWSALSEGDPCDDGDSCTDDEICTEGVCAGSPVDCDDAETCTLDSCEPSEGCIHTALEAGTPCDDGDLCTLDDLCAEGVCSGGETRICDDEDPCTDDACETNAGCVTTMNEAPCEDGAPCTSGDTCSEGECLAGEPTDCDDADICTIDLCDEVVGCVHLPTQNACCTAESGGCNDGDPCTTASCDEATGECIQNPNTAPCDDGDSCTTEDTCADLACVGTPLSCDDQNPCTDDLCSPNEGCIHVPQSDIGCDDGLECSTGDVCDEGVCVADTSECACTPTFGDAVRAQVIEMGDSGNPGSGLNLDGDQGTCSPEGECSEGVDNSLAILAGLVNDSIADAVASGSLNFLIELREPSPGVHLLSAFTGELAPNNPECDPSTEVCEWWVDKSFLDSETCAPIAALDATLNGTSVVGGGTDSVLPFDLPLGDSSLTVTLLNLQFEGELVYTDGQISSFTGVFGGAVPKTALEAAINSVPDEDLPLPKAAILGFMGLLEDDIDSDGDGVADALSMGLKVSGGDAVLTGSQ